MKGRKFNSLMPKYNEDWSAKILGMKVNSSAGPDLIDDEKAVEVKFNLIPNEGYSYKGWKALGHQIIYNETYKEIYWGLGFYRINSRIKEISSREEINESIVLERELYLIEWDWINQFPLYHQKGRTEKSEWDHYISFPKFSLIPQVIEKYNVEGGKLFFTQGVNPKRFDLSTKSL